jgi:hypothetical protein
MKLLAIAGFLLLTACMHAGVEAVQPIVIQAEPIARPGLNLPSVDRIDARPVEWIVVTPENADRILAEMEARGEEPVIFGVNETGYENIAINTQQTLRVILQQQAVIDGYREYYITADGRIRDHNSTVGQ